MSCDFDLLIKNAQSLREYKSTLFLGHNWIIPINEVLKSIITSIKENIDNKDIPCQQLFKQTQKAILNIQNSVSQLEQKKEKALVAYMTNVEVLITTLEDFKEKWG